MRASAWTGAVLAAFALADAGDPAATERRLERAGAPTGLRLQVLEAVARGAAYLERSQRPDGTFLAPGSVNWYAGQATVPVDALCALALEVAGSPSGRRAAGRTLDRLAPPGSPLPEAVRGHVHAASLLARLAVERRADPALAAALGSALALAQAEGTGLWYARARRDTVGFGTLVYNPDPKPVPDLETSHVAVLGLAAAESAGGRAPTAVWTRHLAALHRLQGPDGGWKNLAMNYVSDLGSSAQSMAGLVLGREALLRRGPLPPRLAADIEESLGKGSRFLLEEAADALWIHRRFPGGAAGRTCLLFDLEKALSFTAVPDLDGTPPYAAIAELLLAAQARDGRWAAGGAAADDLAETAFAILALARASEPLRAAPGPALAPRAEPAWPEEGAPPPSATVPLREAEEGLDWLESLLKDPKAPADSLRRTLLFTGRAYLRPADGADDAWCRRAEEAFLHALPGPEGILAARLLGKTRARVSGPMRRVLGDGDLPPALLREGFAALARLQDPESLRWLAEENLSGDDVGPRFDRSREALRGMALFAAAPGPLRRNSVDRIVALYEGVEGAANPYVLITQGKFNPVARARWVACRRFVFDALLALARDPVTGAEPAGKTGARLVTLREYRQWLGDHSDPRKAPWADR